MARESVRRPGRGRQFRDHPNNSELVKPCIPLLAWQMAEPARFVTRDSGPMTDLTQPQDDGHVYQPTQNVDVDRVLAARPRHLKAIVNTTSTPSTTAFARSPSPAQPDPRLCARSQRSTVPERSMHSRSDTTADRSWYSGMRRRSRRARVSVRHTNPHTSFIKARARVQTDNDAQQFAGPVAHARRTFAASRPRRRCRATPSHVRSWDSTNTSTLPGRCPPAAGGRTSPTTTRSARSSRRSTFDARSTSSPTAA